MNKKISIGVTIALVIIAIALTVSVTMVIAMRQFSSLVADTAKRQAMFDYITEIDKLVRQHNPDIDEEKLREALSEGYISGINDPYAAFLSVDEYKDEQYAQEGNVMGFGLEVARSRDNALIITSVQKNAPAAASGLAKGDVITAINGVSVEQDGLSAVRKTLDESQKVLIAYMRDGEAKAVEISASVFALVSTEGYMIGEETGYIRISTFNQTTFDQFKAVYGDLEKQGATHFIFDLRNTSDGSLESAAKVVSYLLPRGAYGYQIPNTANGETITLSAEDTYEMNYSSVTLVNERTAGVAELVAGALQEMGRTTVVGAHTAGKGMVQQCYPTSDGSAIKLSVYRLSLMKGGELEGVGITPNEEVILSADQNMYFDFLTQEEDAQLQKAMEIALNGQQPPVTGSSGSQTEPAA